MLISLLLSLALNAFFFNNIHERFCHATSQNVVLPLEKDLLSPRGESSSS